MLKMPKRLIEGRQQRKKQHSFFPQNILCHYITNLYCLNTLIILRPGLVMHMFGRHQPNLWSLHRCKWVWGVPAGPRREAVRPRVCERPRLLPLLMPKRLQVAARQAELWGWVTKGSRGVKAHYQSSNCRSDWICKEKHWLQGEGMLVIGGTEIEKNMMIEWRSASTWSVLNRHSKLMGIRIKIIKSKWEIKLLS